MTAPTSSATTQLWMPGKIGDLPEEDQAKVQESIQTGKQAHSQVWQSSLSSCWYATLS